MKRIYASLIIVAALLALAFYSSWRVLAFAQEISSALDSAATAIHREDYALARETLQHSAQLCGALRRQMHIFLRTEDFAELEISLCAADGYLELGSAEEAFGELRRAQVQAENLAWLSQRLF